MYERTYLGLYYINNNYIYFIDLLGVSVANEKKSVFFIYNIFLDLIRTVLTIYSLCLNQLLSRQFFLNNNIRNEIKE